MTEGSASQDGGGPPDRPDEERRARLLSALTRRAAAMVAPTMGGSPERQADDASADEIDDMAPEAVARVLETLVAYTGDMLLAVSAEGMIQFVSPSVRRFMGYEPGDLVGQSVFDFIATEDLDTVLELFDEAIDQELPAAIYQTMVTTASGERRWVEAITIDLADDPEIGGFLTTLRDVTDRVAAEQVAVHERQRFEALIDSLPEIIVRLDTDLHPIYGNAAARAYGHAWIDQGEGLPRPFGPDNPSLIEARRELQIALRAGEARTYEISATTRKGEIWYSAMAMPEHDADGNVTGILVVTRDVTVHRARTEELTRRALEDPLTGLANRSRLEAELERALLSAAEGGTPIGVLFADLDGFKEINDQHGHAVGDKLLQAFARRAREALRPSDLIARFGGDEFVVLPNRLHIVAELESLADRLHETVRDPFEIQGRPLSVSLSIGIATATTRSMLSASDLLARADQAMYASKRHGRNRTTAWTSALATEARSANPGRPRR